MQLFGRVESAAGRGAAEGAARVALREGLEAAGKTEGHMASEAFKETLVGVTREEGAIARLFGREATAAEVEVFNRAFSKGVQEISSEMFGTAVTADVRAGIKSLASGGKLGKYIGELDEAAVGHLGLEGVDIGSTAAARRTEAVVGREAVQTSKLARLGQISGELRDKAVAREALVGERAIAKSTEEITELTGRINKLDGEIGALSTEAERLERSFGVTLQSTAKSLQKAGIWRLMSSGAKWFFGTLAVGVAFMLPGEFWQAYTAKSRADALVDVIGKDTEFGGITMHIPSDIIDKEHPALSPFLYADGGETNFYVSKDSGDWARTYMQSADFSGVMVDLGRGYQFTRDGGAHGRKLLPLYGAIDNEYGDKPVDDFVARFQSHLVEGKVPTYFDSPLDKATSVDVDGQKYYDDIRDSMAASVILLRNGDELTTADATAKVKLEAMKLYNDPYEQQSVTQHEYGTITAPVCLPAEGIYVYETVDTPFVQALQGADVKVALKDYVVCLDGQGNIVPLHVVNQARDGFVKNDQVVTLFSLVNSTKYGLDGTKIETGRQHSFDEFKDELYDWASQIQAQVTWMAEQWSKAPVTNLNLTVYGAVNNTLVYTSPTSLGDVGTDDQGNRILDYFICVKYEEDSNNPGKYVFGRTTSVDDADLLISLVTSRVYETDGSLSVRPVTVKENMNPSVWNLIKDRIEQNPNLTPDTMVALGTKYTAGIVNPDGIPLPTKIGTSDGSQPFFYFTFIYGVDQLNATLDKSRKAWGGRDVDATLFVGPFQFTTNRLFNIYFQIPSIDLAINGNYFYQSVNTDYQNAGNTMVFEPTDLFVMTDSPDQLTDNTGLFFSLDERPYAVSVSTGVIYDQSGRKVTDESGVAKTFNVDLLLAKVQENQVRQGGKEFKGISGNKTWDDIQQAQERRLQQQASARGPFSFYQFQLSIPEDDAALSQEMNKGHYIYKSTARAYPTFTDYVVCVKSDQASGTQYGVEFTASVSSLISLVTGVQYDRTGKIAQYDNQALYELVSWKYQGIGNELKQTIQAETADFARLSATVPEQELKRTPVFSDTLRAQLDAQETVIGHPFVKQDPATGKYYQAFSDPKGYFDFNPSDSDIALLYPDKIDQYRRKIGISYDADGKYISHMTGWILRGVMASAGVQNNSDGTQSLIPTSDTIALPFADSDKNVSAGQSGTNLIVSTDSRFPTAGIAAIIDKGSTYYFYYVTQDKDGESMNTYLVRQVDAAAGMDRYIDFVTGKLYRPDGTPDVDSQNVVMTEIYKTADGQSMSIVSDQYGIQAATVNQKMYDEWWNDTTTDGYKRYTLSDDSFNDMDIVVRTAGGQIQYDVTWFFESYDVPVTLSDDGGLESLTLGTDTYTFKSGNEFTNDAGDSLFVYARQPESNDYDYQDYDVAYYVRSSADNPPAGQEPSFLSDSSYQILIQDTFTPTKGIAVNDSLLGDAGVVIKDDMGVQEFLYNDFLFERVSKNADHEYMMHSDALQKRVDAGDTSYGDSGDIRVVEGDTGYMIYQAIGGEELSREYITLYDQFDQAEITQLQRDVWKIGPAVDVLGNNRLVPEIQPMLLQQVTESSLVVDEGNQQLKTNAQAAGLWAMPVIYKSGASYYYQMDALADGSQQYYRDVYDRNYINLENGLVYDQDGIPSGTSLPLDSLRQILNKLNVGVVDGALKFIPGGQLSETVIPQSVKQSSVKRKKSRVHSQSANIRVSDTRGSKKTKPTWANKKQSRRAKKQKGMTV